MTSTDRKQAAAEAGRKRRYYNMIQEVFNCSDGRVMGSRYPHNMAYYAKLHDLKAPKYVLATAKVKNEKCALAIHHDRILYVRTNPWGKVYGRIFIIKCLKDLYTIENSSVIRAMGYGRLRCTCGESHA